MTAASPVPRRSSPAARCRHWGAFIVLCYLVMPTNSVYLFRIFECDTGFGVDGSVEVFLLLTLIILLLLLL